MSRSNWLAWLVGLAVVGALVVSYNNSLHRPNPVKHAVNSSVALPATSPTTPVGSIAPIVLLSCPKDAFQAGSSYDVRFGNVVVPAASPITNYRIDYGDGRVFENSSNNQVFEHRYSRGGTFNVRVTVTDASGRSGSGMCFWTLQLLPSVPRSFNSFSNPSLNIPYPGNGGGPTFCADGSISGSSGRGTCSHHGGIG